MAKKLIRLYEQDTTDFSNNGLKILNPTSAKITRNLIEYTYQLELTHLLDEKGMMLTEERILGYNGQYFRISSIRRNLKEVSVIAKHIFFDLNKNFIEDISIKNKTGSMALSHILGGTSYPHSFSATSDIDTVASSRLVRKNVVSALIGDDDNSFINRWGGELDIDGFTFKLNEQIGKDDGYTIQYGKNLTGLDLQLNMLEVVTRIRPVGFDGIEIDGLYVDSPYIDNYALPIIKEIKYENVKWTGSPNYEEREDDDSYIYDNLAEAQAKLIELATNEFVVNEIDLPKTTINIEFIELSKTEEYKHLKFLQNINIGDTVHIYHKPLDINLKSRCIEYVYDCILNKYETITLGSYTKNFFAKTQNTNNTLDSGSLDVKFSGMVNGVLQQTQKNLNDTITQAMGGYVYKTNNALYIMDTDDISTAQKIWTWSRNGLAFSSNGVNGPYTTGITMDGHIVGSMISVNSIVGEQIQANSIKATNLEIDVQKKIASATSEETVRTLINTGLDGLELSVSKTYATQSSVNSSISGLEKRVSSAEQKITDSAIISTVTSSTTYRNDLSGKVDSNKVVSTINQTAETVKIQASKIQLDGATTVGSDNRYVKIEEANYSVYNGDNTCMRIGYKNWNGWDGVPEFLMGYKGFRYSETANTGENASYFGMQTWGRNVRNNPNAYHEIYYRSDKFGDTSYIRFDEDGTVDYRSLGQTVIKHSASGHGIALGKYVDKDLSYVRPTLHNATDLGHESYRYRTIYATNGSINTSDISLKENINPIVSKVDTPMLLTDDVEVTLSSEDYYEFVKNMPMYTYDYKSKHSEKDRALHNVGFIAQDVADTPVGNEFIFKGEDGVYQYNMQGYVGVLAVALQNSIKENESLKERVNDLEERLSKLEALLGS